MSANILNRTYFDNCHVPVLSAGGILHIYFLILSEKNRTKKCLA